MNPFNSVAPALIYCLAFEPCPLPNFAELECLDLPRQCMLGKGKKRVRLHGDTY